MIQLLWKGVLPGVLLPGVQDVWHVSRVGDGLADAPIKTICVPTISNVQVSFQIPDSEEKTLTIEPVNAIQLEPFPSTPYNDYHKYNATCVDETGSSVYFIDDDQCNGIILKCDVEAPRLKTFIRVGHNNYFERTLVSALDGYLFAASREGVELFKPTGKYQWDLRGTTKGGGDRVIAVSQDCYACRRGIGLAICSHRGNPRSTLFGFSYSGRHYSFNHESDDYWPITGIWIDRLNRLWLVGNSVVCVSLDGEVISSYSESELIEWTQARFIGIDSNGILWCERDEEYAGFLISDLAASGISPSLSTSVERTGMEPTLGQRT